MGNLQAIESNQNKQITNKDIIPKAKACATLPNVKV